MTHLAAEKHLRPSRVLCHHGKQPAAGRQASPWPCTLTHWESRGADSLRPNAKACPESSDGETGQR